MKKLMIYIVIFINSIIALAGICFWAYINNLEDLYIKEITIETGEVVREKMEVRRLSLSPSESKDYSAIFNCHTSGNFEFVLNFEQVNDNGLKSAVNVVVVAGESGKELTTVYEGTLGELLTQKSVYFEDRINAGVPYEITATYSLPNDAGNSINNTLVQFDMDINLYAT